MAYDLIARWGWILKSDPTPKILNIQSIDMRVLIDHIEALAAERDVLKEQRDAVEGMYHTASKEGFAQKARADKAEADNARLLADKVGLQAQIASLLNILDGWDRERADAHNGGLTMHTYGMSPDWYVEAAFWSCYGFSPNDPRGALSTGGADK